MFLKLVAALCCIAATSAENYYSQPQVYLHEQPRYINENLRDGIEYGNHGTRGYDHGGLKKLQQLHSSHGASNYGTGDDHAIKDLAHQSHYDKGAHAALQSSGAQEGHVKKDHDRGSYEREKKYGYEKGYGYEREAKHHDRANDAQSYGNGYKHNENRGHYNRGAQALRDLVSQGNRYKHGSDAYGNNNAAIDISANHNRGSDIASNYGKDINLRDLNVVRPEPVVVYQPQYIHRNYLPGIRNSLERFRYLSGLSGLYGLGGIRGYDLGLGYNYSPLRHGYSNRYLDSEILSPGQPLLGLSNTPTNIYYQA